jgi:hypothetical protein
MTVHEMVVDKLAGRSVANDDARAESGGHRADQRRCSRHRSTRPTRMRDLGARHFANEAVAAPRQRLDEDGVLAERDANLPDGEVDVLVVGDRGVRPQRRTDLFTSDDVSRVREEQRQQLGRLSLQAARFATASQTAGLRVEDVCAECDQLFGH